MDSHIWDERAHRDAPISTKQLVEIWYDFPMVTAIGMKENNFVLLKP